MEHDSGSIHNVISDIRKDIKTTQRSFLNELDEERDSTKLRVKNELKDEYSKLLSEGKSKVDEDIVYLYEQAELNRTKKMLRKRKELFDEFSDAVIEKLRAYAKTEEYHKLLKENISKLKKEHKKIIIYCNENDSKFFKKSASTDIRVLEENILGVIVEDSKRTVRHDLTLDRIYERIKGDYVKKVEIL